MAKKKRKTKQGTRPRKQATQRQKQQATSSPPRSASRGSRPAATDRKAPAREAAAPELPPVDLRSAWSFHRIPLLLAAILTLIFYIFLFLWVRV
jgi:hypothetical protein